jgi:class 3 adenylate cyclase
MIKRIKEIFRSKELPPTYFLELERQSLKVGFLLSILACIIWLRYISIDKLLLKDFPIVISLRYGFTLAGLIAVCTLLFSRYKYIGILVSTTLGLYYIIVIGIIVGLSGSQTAYMGVFSASVLMIIQVPLPRLILWSAIVLGNLSYYVSYKVFSNQALSIEYQLMQGFSFSVSAVAILLVFILDNLRKTSFERAINFRKAEQEKHKLILNILPEKIAEELYQKSTVEPREIKTLNVLFTDFKGFTILSEKLKPTLLIQELNIYFSLFDDICKKHRIERIKTIGDSYMCVSGLFVESTEELHNLLECAIQIRDKFAECKGSPLIHHTKDLEIRIGVHCGPAVAGIVGTDRFAYDVWGDTVNIASRMEAISEPGQITVSEPVFMAGKGAFSFDSRGQISVKGKGMMEAYFLRSKYGA